MITKYVSTYLPGDLLCFCVVHLDSEFSLPQDFLKFTFNIGKDSRIPEHSSFLCKAFVFFASFFIHRGVSMYVWEIQSHHHFISITRTFLLNFSKIDIVFFFS